MKKKPSVLDARPAMTIAIKHKNKTLWNVIKDVSFEGNTGFIRLKGISNSGKQVTVSLDFMKLADAFEGWKHMIMQPEPKHQKSKGQH